MNTYTNTNLREVVCRFTFLDDGAKKWDSGYFGQFFDKIKDLGFSSRHEQRGIQLTVGENVQEIAANMPVLRELESQMVFQNPEKGFAITLGNKILSFHVLGGGYRNWETFQSDLLEPYLKLYLDLGLHTEANYCQVVYLNQFSIGKDEALKDYFTIATDPVKHFGLEGAALIQKRYVNTDLGYGLVYKLMADVTADDRKSIYLECGAESLPTTRRDAEDLPALASRVREPIRDFFENLITDQLRAIL